MALLNAVDKWRHYLQFKHFVVKTDHHSLKYLLEQRVTSAIQQKGLTKLLSLDYEVRYKKGAENGVADALSRRDERLQGSEKSSAGLQMAVSMITPMWIQEIMHSYTKDPYVQELLTLISVDVHEPSLWHNVNGVLRKKGYKGVKSLRQVY